MRNFLLGWLLPFVTVALFVWTVTMSGVSFIYWDTAWFTTMTSRIVAVISMVFAFAVAVEVYKDRDSK